MFRYLAAQVPDGAARLSSLHPAELTALIEQAWNLRVNLTTTPTGTPDHRSGTPGLAIPQMPLPVLTPPSLQGASPDPAAQFTAVLTATADRGQGVRWDHLIYAYMIGNTRIRPIFRRVVHELLHGEKFGVPREDTQLWLRNTEELFFRDPPPFSITTLTSAHSPRPGGHRAPSLLPDVRHGSEPRHRRQHAVPLREGRGGQH